jgi:hypothetical protein
MHVVGQDDLISIAQFDLDQHQNISSPQTECNSLLSLCPYIKHVRPPRRPAAAVSPASSADKVPILRFSPHSDLVPFDFNHELTI